MSEETTFYISVTKFHQEKKEQTWINLLKIKQCRYTIFIFLLEFGDAIKHSLRVIWSKYATKEHGKVRAASATEWGEKEN